VGGSVFLFGARLRNTHEATVALAPLKGRIAIKLYRSEEGLLGKRLNIAFEYDTHDS
jgi:hypothetical protein